MIYLCPFCGHQLSRELIDGFTSCHNCSRVVDSSIYNKLLSASHIARKNPHIGLEQFKFETKLSNNEAIFIYTFVIENCYSHDEFQQLLKVLGISTKILT